MPDKITNVLLPFAEQIAFFKGKLNLPTEKWDDILTTAHDQAFVVAGAQNADMLQDLRDAVDGAISEGQSIQKFRESFDAIVEKYGWSYTGARDWRTRVIYRTNMSTSYAAGRNRQMQRFEFWQYKHNDSAAHPRPLHQSWDGLVLPKSDPWWQTHFPPNGWGCGCRAVAMTPGEARAAGKTVAPDDGTYTKTGSDGTVHTIPRGIDYGFDYAPGAPGNAWEPDYGRYAPELADALRQHVAGGTS